MNLPRISIVTPAYNAQEFIEETITSVLDQNYPNLQYIIIDGGSTDNTPCIIKKYERYLDFWVSEPDNGQSDAINKGLSLCDGVVFNWLNADDTYTNDTLRIVSEAFADDSTAVLAGRSQIFGIGQDRLSPGTDIYFRDLDKTIGRARIDQPETFFRTQLIRRSGGIDTSLEYLFDRELWMRYLLHYGLKGIKKTHEVLARFRLHKNSKTVSKQCFFKDESYRICKALLSKPSEMNLDLSLLRHALHTQTTPAKLDAIRGQFLLHHFEMSYAERNFNSMEQFDTLMSKHVGPNSYLFKRLNLKLRSLFINSLS
jgi:glycosyltransferase involved in cell wall biosynthesis